MPAAVLVVAADLSIEALLGELVAFVGHRPIFDPTIGAAGESVRRVRPDLVLLDTALSPVVVAACLDAAREVSAEPVLVSSTASREELEQQADVLQCHYFVLPGSVPMLGQVLERALTTRRAARAPAHALSDHNDSVNPAIRAALASVARARSLAMISASARVHGLKFDLQYTLDEARRGRSALRAAITDFALQLKAAEMPLERVTSLVQDTVADCASLVGAQSAVPSLLDDAEQWVKSAFLAA